ncbi:unnamed protein product [Scytosiphon promiscuus]
MVEPRTEESPHFGTAAPSMQEASAQSHKARSGAGAEARDREPSVYATTSAVVNEGGSSANNTNSTSPSGSIRAVAPAKEAQIPAQDSARSGATIEARVQAQQQQGSPSDGVSSPACAARLRRVEEPHSSNGGHHDEAGGDEDFNGDNDYATDDDDDGDSTHVDMSGAPPVAKRWALRCLVQLTYLIVARGIWAGTLWITAGVAGRRGTSNGGGVSWRQRASSIARQSEGFRSLEEAMAEWRRYVKEIEKEEQNEHRTLESLRFFVQRLNDQVELLRKKATGGVCSGGTPEDPEASGLVSLSQAEEVSAKKDTLAAQREATSDAIEEGEKWAKAAAGELEALATASHSTSPYQLSSRGKVVSNQDAEQTRRAGFVTPLKEAFLALERVHNTVNAMDVLRAAKPGSKEISSFVKLVEEAKASDAVGENRGLQERVEVIAAREVLILRRAGMLRVALTFSPGAAAFIAVAAQTRELVAQEVEIFSAGGTGMPDHASLDVGGSVVYGQLVLSKEEMSENADAGVEEGQLTSPTLASSTLSWTDYLLHVLRVPGRGLEEGADAALTSANSLGSCFAFLGGEGRLTVKLARPPVPLSAAGSPALGSSSSASSSSLSAPSGGVNGGGDRDGFIRVTHVSIEHARTASAPTAQKNAPRSFRVLGWDEDPGGLAATAKGEENSEKMDRPPRPHVLLEEAEYEAGGGARGVQTFAVPEGVREATPAVGWVTLEVQSNHGGGWTCLYGFRVHGDHVDQSKRA